MSTNRFYRIAWWKVFVLFFTTAFLFTMPPLRIVSFRFLMFIGKILIFILPLSINRPDDILFWVFFLMLFISLTLFRKSRELVFGLIWGLMKFLLLTENKRKRKLKNEDLVEMDLDDLNRPDGELPNNWQSRYEDQDRDPFRNQSHS